MPIQPCWSLLALPDTSLEHRQEGHDWEDEEACSQADDRDEEEALEAVLVDMAGEVHLSSGLKSPNESAN